MPPFALTKVLANQAKPHVHPVLSHVNLTSSSHTSMISFASFLDLQARSKMSNPMISAGNSFQIRQQLSRSGNLLLATQTRVIVQHSTCPYDIAVSTSSRSYLTLAHRAACWRNWSSSVNSLRPNMSGADMKSNHMHRERLPQERRDAVCRIEPNSLFLGYDDRLFKN